MTDISLEGAHNVRDVGGLPAAGGATRARVLLRGDALDALTPSDVARLVEDLGLAQVIDLRTGSERIERGRGLLGQASVRYTPLDVIDDQNLVRRAQVRAELFAGGTDPSVVIADGYAELLELGAPAFVAAIEHLVEPGGTPALVHCSLGKDRTGVLVALLLDAAGVERTAIVADYAASNEPMGAIRERMEQSDAFRELARKIPAFTFQAEAATMERFLDHLSGSWGGGGGYFAANGVDPELLDRWRATLVGR